MKILVVDDEVDVGKTIALMLTRLGHACETASGGEEALQKCREQSFDLVLTDLGMPGINGLELAERIREITSDIRIILITGWSVSVSPDQLSACGIERVLDKPARLQELVAALAATPSAGSPNNPDSKT
jgi:CheY-like chemotaxis protein